MLCYLCYFSYKDPIPDDLKSLLVYKLTCASCSSSYIGETGHHFKTRIEEHIKKDNKSHIFKHLHSTAKCFDLYNFLSFKIIDNANSKFDLKIKEVLQIKINESQYIALFVVSGSIKKLFPINCVNIYFSQSIANYPFSVDLKVWGYPTLLIPWFINFNWRKPNINVQQNHLALTLSLVIFCLFFCLFALLFHLLFLLSLTLIIGIFYYLNYTSLLLHLIITHLVNISLVMLSSIFYFLSIHLYRLWKQLNKLFLNKNVS